MFFYILFKCTGCAPAVHLITTVYTTVVRTRECVCVREAGEVTAAVKPAGRVTSVVCMRG